jgi:hypothetical protein
VPGQTYDENRLQRVADACLRQDKDFPFGADQSGMGDHEANRVERHIGGGIPQNP